VRNLGQRAVGIADRHFGITIGTRIIENLHLHSGGEFVF
jgi:hypothetical protein